MKQEDLRKRHEWVRSVISRPAQYHRYAEMGSTMTTMIEPGLTPSSLRLVVPRFMMNDFENLKLIHDFRTASTLRGYGFVFLTIAPVLLGPYVRRIPCAPPAAAMASTLTPPHLRPQFAWYSDNNGLWAGVFISVFTRCVP